MAEPYLFQEECNKIIGACIDVHKTLGHGFLENVYEEAMVLELFARSVHYEQSKKLEVYYKGRKLNKFYIADLICFGTIILEIKAMNGIADEHISQVLNYLTATNLRLGLLINFGASKIQIKRVIR